MEREIRRVRGARYILIPASEETRGHASPMRARLWQQYLRRNYCDRPIGRL